MPILTDASVPTDWIEPDDVARPVVTYGIASKKIDKIELDMHRHAKGQILLVQHGALSCQVERGLWIVPPRSAVWIPGGALHAIKATGSLEGYSAFVAPDVDARLPGDCCTVSVTPRRQPTASLRRRRRKLAADCGSPRRDRGRRR
jgi:hypothetical protein